jgi:ribA/ribD-fused uncharacterized protein
MAAAAPAKINLFKYEWACYSNFYAAPVKLDGVEYPSVEHAYQAAKTLDPKKRIPFQSITLTSGKAKRMGRGFREGRGLRPDWRQVNVGIMRDLLMQKFAHSLLKRKLLSSLQAELEEGNYWHDTFWGVCYGKIDGRTCDLGEHEPIGENYLGKLLMEVRAHYATMTE